MFRRPFNQKAVNNNSRQGYPDQNIPNGPAPLQADLSAFKQKEADSREQEHLKNLFDQNKDHVFPFLPVLFSAPSGHGFLNQA